MLSYTTRRECLVKLRLFILYVALVATVGFAGYVLASDPASPMTSSLVLGNTRTSSAKVAGARTKAQRVARLSRGTYLGKLLTDRDSILERWPDRVERPIRVWIERADSLAEWKPEYVEPVENAFHAWSATGIPVRFEVTDDSARAEVRVFWAERLDRHTAGMTFWQSDQQRWMRAARVTIALRASDGGRQNARGISSIALHEVGHLLGLSHSPHAGDIMAPWVTARTLSDGDEATVRLLYALPAGKI